MWRGREADQIDRGVRTVILFDLYLVLRIMKYQLVLQFDASSMETFDQLVMFENKLSGELNIDVAIVDGHDFGLGEFNIFIHTDVPTIVFEKAKQIFKETELHFDLRAGYRDFTSEDYLPIWPSGLTTFQVA